jgi:hypothetical protein
VSWKESLVKEYYDRVLIVFIHDLGVYGSTEKLGAFASIVKYKKNEMEYEELIDNAEFSIMDEIVFSHVEEEYNG